MSLKKKALYVMSVLYIFAGIWHFVDPQFYIKMMPSFLPWHEFLVILSGIIEIALGAALLYPPLRTKAAWGVIALLIAVFPANINMLINQTHAADMADMGAMADIGLWIRLPIQGLLIWWAYLYTKPLAD